MVGFYRCRSAAVLDQEITDNLLHELQLCLPGLIDPNPERSLKGSIQIFRDQ